MDTKICVAIGFPLVPLLHFIDSYFKCLERWQRIYLQINAEMYVSILRIKVPPKLRWTCV